MSQRFNPTPVDIDAQIKVIKEGMGPPEFRAAYGQHVKFAWIVRALVEQGYGVTQSVKQVVDKAGLTPPKKVERSLRASYYKIRDREWPADMARAVANNGVPDSEEAEEFEV